MEEQQHSSQKTAPTTSSQASDQQEGFGGSAVEHHTIMAVLCYFGILVIIPYMMAKQHPFVYFHIKQGVVLAGLWVVLFVLGMMTYGFMLLFALLQLGVLVLSIVGMVHAIQGKETELPLIGSFAKGLNI